MARVAVKQWEPRSDKVSDPEDGGGVFLWNSFITDNTDVAEIGRPLLWLSSVFEISVFVYGSRHLTVAPVPIQGSEQLEILLNSKIPIHTPIITKTEDDRNCFVYVLVAFCFTHVCLTFFFSVTPLYQLSSLFNFRSVIFGLTLSNWLRTRTYPTV